MLLISFKTISKAFYSENREIIMSIIMLSPIDNPI